MKRRIASIGSVATLPYFARLRLVGKMLVGKCPKPSENGKERYNGKQDKTAYSACPGQRTGTGIDRAENEADTHEKLCGICPENAD